MAAVNSMIRHSVIAPQVFAFYMEYGKFIDYQKNVRNDCVL